MSDTRMTKDTTKTGFIKELTADGAKWIYVWCGDAEKHNVDFIAAKLNEIGKQAQSGKLDCGYRTYRHTSGYRVISSTGSILDLTKREHIRKFDNGYIVENDYSRWAYLRTA